jgi:hypothetical protein
MKMILEQTNPHSCKTYLFGIKDQKEVALIDPVIEHVQE